MTRSMLKSRILSTLRFFDLQDYPLTLLELHKFLIGDIDILKQQIDTSGEIIFKDIAQEPKLGVEQVLLCLERECKFDIQNTFGFYHLKGRQAIAESRLSNYFFGLRREK